MADDHTQRAYRSNEYAREPAKTAQGSDPLAELARLIGQTDPFAEFGRKPEAPATHQQTGHQAQDWTSQPYATDDYTQPTDFQPGYSQAGYDEQGGRYDSDQYYQDDGYQLDQPYDDVPPPRRRMGILAVAAVVVLAVVGTAGAVGYRALFGPSGNSPPPVIKADTTPSKVVPPTKSEQQPNKLIYDRVGERSSGEKIVSREEQPLDINKAPQPTFPSAFPSRQPSMTAGSGSVPLVDQPKKIHTIAIRPDQPMNQPEPAPSPPDHAANVAPPPPPPPMPPAPRQAAPQRLASAPQMASAAPEAPAARSVPAHQAPRNAPLSLSPNAAAPAIAPARTASAPAIRNPMPSAGTAGQYTVQISSQRSEAEAQAAFRALQARYPTQLGGRQPIIRRADLGSKGVYYRAMVGPFASRSEAGDMCQALKAAGGPNCFVQKN
jgi:hypothetical protein